MLLADIDKDSLNGEIVLKPNMSASWQSNMRFFVFLVVLSIVIAGGFALMGAWMILPFAGLGLCALFGGMYYFFLQRRQVEILRFTDECVIVEKGRKESEFQWQCHRVWAKAHIERSPYANHPNVISIAYQGEKVPIGEFLGESEQADLIQHLRKLIGVL